MNMQGCTPKLGSGRWLAAGVFNPAASLEGPCRITRERLINYLSWNWMNWLNDFFELFVLFRKESTGRGGAPSCRPPIKTFLFWTKHGLKFEENLKQKTNHETKQNRIVPENTVKTNVRHLQTHRHTPQTFPQAGQRLLQSFKKEPKP